MVIFGSLLAMMKRFLSPPIPVEILTCPVPHRQQRWTPAVCEQRNIRLLLLLSGRDTLVSMGWLDPA